MPNQKQKEPSRLDRLGPLADIAVKPKVEEQVKPLQIEQKEEPFLPEEEVNTSHPGGRPVKSDEEKATEKVTAYFTPEQYDKIEELQRAHRKKTKKRISVNELLRRLVTTANIDDILPRP